MTAELTAPPNNSSQQLCKNCQVADRGEGSHDEEEKVTNETSVARVEEMVVVRAEREDEM